ncbi:hypothetical protein STENM327S_05179 [Streptomyces tendae]
MTGGKNDMTGDAPIGELFAKAAEQIPTQVIGPKDQIVQQGLTDNGVILVTQGKSAKDAWENAVKTINSSSDLEVTGMTTRHDTAASRSRGAPPGPPPGGRASAEADRKRRAKLSRRWQRDMRWSPYAFVSPFFLLFLAFGLFPLIYTGWASLHTVELTAPTDMKWTGLDNYTRIFDDEFERARPRCGS